MRSFVFFALISLSCSLWAQDPKPGLASPVEAGKDPEALLAEAERLQGAGRETEAFALFLKASEQGQPAAMSALGQCYWLGKGTVPDQSKAAEWIQKAAEKGDRRGETLWGLFLLQGIGVGKNEKRAVPWLRKGADKGHPRALSILASLHMKGSLVPRDPVQAMALYGKAAEQGDTEGLTMLGYGYVTGTGVSKDEKRAEELWQKALSKGNRQARRNLGILYASQKRWGAMEPGPDPFAVLEPADPAQAKALDALASWAGLEAGDSWKNLEPVRCMRPPFQLLLVPMVRKTVPEQSAKAIAEWELPEGQKLESISVTSVSQEYAVVREHGVPSDLPVKLHHQALLGNPPRDLLEFEDITGQHWQISFDIASFFGKFDQPETPAAPEEALAIAADLEAQAWAKAAEPKRRKALAEKAPNHCLRHAADMLASLLDGKADPKALADSARNLRRLLPYCISAQAFAGVAFLRSNNIEESKKQKGWALQLVLAGRGEL